DAPRVVLDLLAGDVEVADVDHVVAVAQHLRDFRHREAGASAVGRGDGDAVLVHDAAQDPGEGPTLRDHGRRIAAPRVDRDLLQHVGHAVSDRRVPGVVLDRPGLVDDALPRDGAVVPQAGAGDGDVSLRVVAADSLLPCRSAHL